MKPWWGDRFIGIVVVAAFVLLYFFLVQLPVYEECKRVHPRWYCMFGGP